MSEFESLLNIHCIVDDMKGGEYALLKTNNYHLSLLKESYLNYEEKLCLFSRLSEHGITINHYQTLF